jgi:hypothetical protein
VGGVEGEDAVDDSHVSAKASKELLAVAVVAADERDVGTWR